MEKLPEYIQAIEDGVSFVENYNNLLESLRLSKQANDNNLYTDETTDGISDVSFDPSEGIGESSDPSFA